MRTRPIYTVLVASLGLMMASLAVRAGEPERDRPRPPSLTVTGRAEVDAAPDQALVRLGAIAQTEQASAAQDQVNRVVQRATDRIKALGVPDRAIRTAGLSLTPVYAPLRKAGDEARIIGYRASNIVEVRLDDLKRVGEVIDAGIGAGANRLEGLSFHLRDDTDARRQALTRAAREAQLKAETIAAAMGVRLDGVAEIVEDEVGVIRPQMDFARANFAGAEMAATPVQPGEIQVGARLIVRYRIAGGN